MDFENRVNHIFSTIGCMEREGGKRQECIQEMLANKNTLLRKNRQMHKKCINFVQVNAIVNSRIHRPHNTFVMAYLKCL